MTSRATKEDIFRPWLAAGLVALFAVQCPVSRINDMCKLEHVEHWTGGGAKNTPRLFSFASVVQIYTLYLAAQDAGVSPSVGKLIGRAAIARVVERIEAGTLDGPNFDEAELFFWFGLEGSPQHLLLTRPQLAAYYTDPDYSAPDYKPADLNFIFPPRGAYRFPVDELLDRLWQNYREITPHFNQLALQGRLKPFPKNLQ